MASIIVNFSNLQLASINRRCLKQGSFKCTTIPNFDFNDKIKTSFIQLHLKIAWICGIVYFITGFVEFAADWSRYYEDNYFFGKGGYIALKLIVLQCYLFFMRGFVILGTILDKYLLKFSAVLLIILSLVFYGYDMMSIYYPIMDVEYVLISSSILFGLSGFIFGYALLNLDEFLGIWATVAGGITIAASFFLFTVFLGWLGLLFLVPAVLIQIILLSKTAHFMQLKQNKH